MERTSARPTRVVIVEREPAVRRGLRIRLDAEPDLEVVGTAADLAQARTLVRGEAHDLVLLDGGLVGAAAVAAVQGTRTGSPVVVLGLRDDAASRAGALAAGAAAFVSKHDGDAALLAAIRGCAARVGA